MELRKFGLCLAIAASFVLSGAASTSASEITDSYMEALEKNDRAAMTAIIEDNKDTIPAEVQALIDEANAAGTTAEEKGSILYAAELIARSYKDVTGDLKPLLKVKKRTFDARLSEPVRPNLTEGVHIVDLPNASEDVKNVFKPDNIIIKQGETVRWVNSDGIDHIFSTMPVISAGRFSASSIPPGGSWEYTFEKPGEYFYLCFIHQSMVGKVTVEGVKDAGAEQAPGSPAVAGEKDAPEQAETPPAP